MFEIPLAANAILGVFGEWDQVNLDSSLVTGVGQDQKSGVREKIDYNEHPRFYYKRTKIHALTLFYHQPRPACLPQRSE